MKSCSSLKWVLIAFLFRTVGFANDVKPVPNYPPQDIPTDKAAAASGAANHGHGGSHGSHAAEAVASAHQAGQMAKLLAMKSFVDYMQRQQMEKALADLGRKLEKVRGDVKSGVMTPTEYAAVQAAVNAAYERGAKANLPTDKEIDKSLLKSAEADSLKSRGTEDLSQRGTSQNTFEKQSGLMGSDIAQIDANRNPFKVLSSEKALQSGEGSSVNSAKQGFSSEGNGLGAPALLTLPGAQGSPVNQITVQAIAQNDHPDLMKSGTESLGKSARKNQNPGSEEDLFGSFEEDELTASQTGFDFDEGKAERAPTSLIATEGWQDQTLKNQFRKILRPIKIQKNPFSMKLQTEQGIHPGFLLLLVLLAFIGGKAIQRRRKSHVIIPEVILAPEIGPSVKNGSKSLVASKRA